MGSYLETIQTSVLFFPLIALLFTTPYMISQYHKYGAIHTFRTLIIYSFILYLLTAYFLVILPLPTISEVAQLTTPRTQLIPFSFIADFITHTSFQWNDPSTYLQALKEPYFYQVIYNLILTIPFGIYLRYYFKCNFKKTVLFTFCLTLFFEVTQLTGLYGIYPRNYRLFDVDDLMINTLGGVVGYFLAGMLQKVIPTRDRIDIESYQLGKHVSPLRRMITFGCDSFLYFIFVIGYTIGMNPRHSFLIMFLVYYFILPLCLNGQTIAEKFFHLQIVTTDHLEVVKKNWILRRILFYLLYFVFPFLLAFLYVQITDFFKMTNMVSWAFGFCCMMIIVVFYCYSFIRFFFFHKPLLYETMSHTAYKSTIPVEEDNT